MRHRVGTGNAYVQNKTALIHEMNSESFETKLRERIMLILTRVNMQATAAGSACRTTVISTPAADFPTSLLHQDGNPRSEQKSFLLHVRLANSLSPISRRFRQCAAAFARSGELSSRLRQSPLFSSPTGGRPTLSTPQLKGLRPPNQLGTISLPFPLNCSSRLFLIFPSNHFTTYPTRRAFYGTSSKRMPHFCVTMQSKPISQYKPRLWRQRRYLAGSSQLMKSFESEKNYSPIAWSMIFGTCAFVNTIPPRRFLANRLTD
jgi:hypothetical protein